MMMMADSPQANPLPETVFIMRDQAVQLIAITTLLQGGHLQIHGDGADDAWRALIEIGQECALQQGGMP